VNLKFHDPPGHDADSSILSAVLGRLKYFARPYDFVLAPMVNNVQLDIEGQAEIEIVGQDFMDKFVPEMVQRVDVRELETLGI